LHGASPPTAHLVSEVSEDIVTTRPDPASRAAAEATVPEPATPKDLDGTGPAAAPACGHWRSEVTSEAQHELIALAQALARQAAREDDAAERLAERLRPPPDVAVEILPGGDGKEDTS
jgi:hypothetical protein